MGIFLTFLAGIVLGAALFAWVLSTKRRSRRRIPKEWPLQVRPLVNSREKRVWTWLNKAMFDQQVLVKLPVTRFTSPSVQKDADTWYKLLNGVYCTFTVCGLDGRVVGCVDVPGRKGLSLSNQTLKHSLLEQCNIRYWVIDPENFPHLSQIRSAFLGDKANLDIDRKLMDHRFKDVRDSLQAAVQRRRTIRPDSEAVVVTEMNNSEYQALFSENSVSSTSAWEQNSFVTPLDSRNASIRRQ